ncbi:prolipoprotein diacylglyceryl transferase [Candidatus Dependentiae bacterium]|nr:prolipoprotein diacylglyceryl transferase [Candidatus Dependentiae bacterium]
MYRKLIHFYGPFSINSFGVMIAIGLGIFTWLTLRHPWREKLISKDSFIQVLSIGTIVGIIGGRILFIISDWKYITRWYDIFAIWEGGFSLLGTVISIAFFLPMYLKKINIPILPFCDLVALHAPLLQSISRIGCFIAGCCYGSQTQLLWNITYTHHDAFAPLCIPLHPTQLYSAIGLFFIFLLMYFITQKLVTKPGQVLYSYLMLVSSERFIIDFFRGDREFYAFFHLFSIHQYIAFGIFFIASILLLLTLINKKKN